MGHEITMADNRPIHLFLSYSREDTELVKTIRAALEGAGHTVWQDTTAIKGGAEWIDSISEGVKQAYAVVTVVSDSSQKSRWVRLEFLEADRRKKPIIPFKIDASEIPMELLDRNVLHGYPDFQHGLEKLLAALPSKPDFIPIETPLDPRQLELDYLDKLLLEHAVWQEVYTPMAGVGQLQKKISLAPKTQIVTVPTNIAANFRQHKEKYLPKQEVIETETREFTDILTAIADLRHLVVLGDPGAGKTTTLWRILADYAQAAKADPTQPLPVFIRLGALGGDLMGQIQTQLAPLEVHQLLVDKRLAILLDGLNEVPSHNRAAAVSQIKALVKHCQADNLLVVVTCRELDYQGELDLGIPDKVVITPLDPVRIHQFVKGYIQEPPDAGENLFWQIADGASLQAVWNKWRGAGADFHLFWTATAIPKENPNVYNSTSSDDDRVWREERFKPRSMLQLATNPFMLYMITQVYTEEGKLPPNRGALFAIFMDFLLVERERLTEAEADALQDRLADLGYEMQRQGEGTTFPKAEALRYLQTEANLYRALSASILTGADELRFSHQLLQEYFAAKRLDREMQAKTPATQFFPPEKWWEPTGWEETAILLAGLYSDDCTPVLNWLKEAQPELTARCVVESGANTQQTTLENLSQFYVPRMTDIVAYPRPEDRAGFGRALGRIDYDTLIHKQERPLLDTRRGVGAKAGLPDIDWVEIPAGDFTYQKDKKLTLPTYWLSRYPITYAQFQTFVDDPDGYPSQTHDWFEGLAADESDRQVIEQWFKYATHPCESVNWYQAVAFCRWWSHRLGGQYGLDQVMNWAVRLPTEQEWEKAARGTDGRLYPYGNEFDATKGNTRETGLGQTSTVGIFPQGASPYGLQDMSGNVFEWCLTEYGKPDQLDIRSNGTRVLRGGSWFNVSNSARAVSRRNPIPNFRYLNDGFRVLCMSPFSNP